MQKKRTLLYSPSLNLRLTYCVDSALYRVVQHHALVLYTHSLASARECYNLLGGSAL